MSHAPVRWMMTGKGEPLVEVEFDPVPTTPDEVVVEIAGCGVCHTDLGYYYDGVRTNHALPLTLGHEISGRVVAAGADARLLDRQDRHRAGGHSVRNLRRVPARQADDLPQSEDAGQRYPRRFRDAHRRPVTRPLSQSTCPG